jgi:hypothetical protein
VSCLAILSDFEDYDASFLLMREDARQHPKLDSDPKEQPLRYKLVELARLDIAQIWGALLPRF